MKFFECDNCNIIVEIVDGEKMSIVCEGEVMKEMIPDSVDAATEKHVPVVTVNGKTIHVNVGEVEHPMQDEHYIKWIAIETKEGVQRKMLCPGTAPKVTFELSDTDEFVTAVAYCNLHGLWKIK